MNPYEREVKHLRHVISTAKLVATFSAAFAATFVASTLQTDARDGWDIAAAVLMVPTLVLTFCVVFLRPKHHLEELGAAAFDSVKLRADWAHLLTVIQVGLAAAASGVAAIGLLVAHRHSS
jgi:spore maturation protein SpmB